MGCGMSHADSAIVRSERQDTKGEPTMKTATAIDRVVTPTTCASASEVGSVSSETGSDDGISREAFAATPLPGGFTQVKRLAPAIHGDIFLYEWQELQTTSYVAVKRLITERLNGKHEASELADEDACMEMAIFSYLSRQIDCCPYLLKLRGIFTDGPQYTWLITEFAEGGELFALAASGNRLLDVDVKHYFRQLLQAVAYLHRHRIGHRDISLENILLKDGCVRLMDFGLAVQSHCSFGIARRFLRAVGKDFYRAPECYVPSAEKLSVLAPQNMVLSEATLVQTGGFLCEVRFPAGATAGDICSAEVCGYAAQPVDIFACAICLFILCFSSPAWEKAVLSDQAFKLVHSQAAGGIDALLKRLGRPSREPIAMNLLANMLQSDPVKRPVAYDCLDSAWFGD